jgi:hypothetical protein
LLKDIKGIDKVLLIGMGICLLAYIAGHFVGNPFPEMLSVMQWLGIGLGLTTSASVVSK